MDATVSWQMGLLEDQEPQRLFSWIDMFMKILREKIGVKRWDVATDEERKKLNKLIDYYLWIELPQTKQAIEAILETGDVEAGIEIVAALFSDPNLPSSDTIARGKRQARENLREAGLLIDEPPPSPDPRSFDELLSQINPKEQSFTDRFIEAVIERFQKLEWQRYQKITLPNGLQITAALTCVPYKLIIEVDTWRNHRTRDKFSEDRLNSRQLAIHGWTCLRFSGSELSITGGFQRAMRHIATFIERKQATQFVELR